MSGTFWVRTAVAMLLAGPCWGHTVVVDNADPGFSVVVETWPSASGSGQYGTDYRYRSTSGEPGTVMWEPTLPAAGEYEVSVWYRHGYDRPDDAHYTVEHAGGTSDVFVDQSTLGSQWVPIGVFPFEAGNAGCVRLSSEAEPGKTIVADVVRFVGLPEGETLPELRACWLTHYAYVGRSDAQLRAIAQDIRAGHMNTVYIAMYSGASVYWPSRAYKAAGGYWASSTIDYAAYLTRLFHEEGLKVGAWFEYGMALGPATHPIAVAHPDWLARDRFGDSVTGENGGFVFLSPGHPDAVNMVVQMACELAADYDFDDIQLDRIRWGRKTDGREYGYEDCTADLYRAAYGVSPPTNKNSTQWVAFREGLVNEVVQQSYEGIKAVNPLMVVSSAPTGSYGITQHMQRWSTWVAGGYMDLVMPQMYKTSYDAFVTEFNTQVAQVPGHVDKLGVGYRASEDDDWALVAGQMNYARSHGVPHGCLWVYHQYTDQIAIRDEIDHLPMPGQPWEAWAHNPYVSDRHLQVVVDNRDGSGAYEETGTWFDSAQPDFFRFDSRVAEGGGTAKTAAFSAAVPLPGRYDVHVWYTAAANRNDAAAYTIEHYGGATTVPIDHRFGGGQWVRLGRWVFEDGPVARRVTITTDGSEAGEYTSADAVKLVLSGYALGDATGDGLVDTDDYALLAACVTGPTGGPLTGACEAFDFDDDTDVDVADLADFQCIFGDM